MHAASRVLEYGRLRVHTRGRTWSFVLALALFVGLVSVLTIPAASAQAAGPSLTITPTSGPIGTVITASIINCPPPPPDANGDQLARLDFAFVTGTPAATESFTPDPDGTATVTIEATDKEAHAGETEAQVNVWQCGGDATAMGSAPFTVVRDQQPTSFGDVPSTHPHAPGIEWLVAEGITQGCAPELFCPADPVTRGQMATFLQRALDLPDGSVDEFSDVSPDHPHAKGIGAVAAAGITAGCDEERYCPNDPVSRAQMATFLQRALDLPAGSVAQFDDVSPSHPHARGIGAVAEANITAGCTTDRYCPADPVSRGQMATFLMRALQ